MKTQGLLGLLSLAVVAVAVGLTVSGLNDHKSCPIADQIAASQGFTWPRCCAKLMPVGMSVGLSKCDAVAIGTIQKANEDGTAAFQVRQVLISNDKDLNTIFVGAAVHYHVGVETLVFFRDMGKYRTPVFNVPMDAENTQLVATAVLKTQAWRSQPKDGAKTSEAAAALFNLLIQGQSGTSLLAAQDLALIPQLASALTPESVKKLQTELIARGDRDLILLRIAEIIGQHPQHPRSLTTLVAAAQKQDASRLLPTLIRIFKKAPFEQPVTALVTALQETQSLAAKRRLAHVLARLDSSEARAALAVYLQNTEDKQLQASALLAHVKTETPQARSLALDVIRVHIDPKAPKAKSEFEKDYVLNLKTKLATGVAKGEQLRLMAAGYFLVHFGNEQILEWLKTQLPKLDDPAVSMFIKDRMNERWKEFDAAW